MSEVWPYDSKAKLDLAIKDNIRPFKCLLLMPFESRFDSVATLISETVEATINELAKNFGMALPKIDRLDWVKSSGVIQQQLWQKVLEADLIFCDITGYNPNVMFEAGVCSAWKNIESVVFIRDSFYKQESIFDIAPIRYTEYSMVSDRIESFKDTIRQLTNEAYIRFPDSIGSPPEIRLPIRLDFKDNIDSKLIYTPPLSHRRVKDGALEFGSLHSFAHSWASIGKTDFDTFTLRFKAKFLMPVEENYFQDTGYTVDQFYIGVGLHSQHFYAQYGHIIYLRRDGRIVMAQPTEISPLYRDVTLRLPTDIDVNAYHDFKFTFTDFVLQIEIDDFVTQFNLHEMDKVLGPGLIRFQSFLNWMAISEIQIDEDVT